MKAEWETKPFEPGEVIEFAGDRYTVLANHGTSGAVLEDGVAIIDPFYWRFQDEDCIRVVN